MFRLLTTLALALAATAPAHAVNKCTGPDGKVVYQATPCAGAADAAKVNLSGAGQANLNSPVSTYWRIEAAIQNRQVMVGMTAAQAARAWGQPGRVNTTVTASGAREQWVYGNGRQGRQYIYVDDGVVSAVQTRD
jgi:Domain of unknown function (DUF4124)